MTDKANRWFYDPWIIAIVGGLVVGILILLVEIMLKANNQVSAGVDNTPSSVPENAPDHRVLGGSNAPHPSFPAVGRFSYRLGLWWGPIQMDMTRSEIEQKVGPLQCFPVDYDGYHCSCRGVFETVTLSFELRSRQTGDDPNVCLRTDAQVASLTILLTPEEQSATHQAIINEIRGRLPEFRLVRGPEPSPESERSRFKPVYSFADGAYNLVVDYEADAIHVR